MDVFEKIEEYEKKVSIGIKNKMDLFTNLMLDKEIFDKMISNTADASISVEKGTKDVIEEIQSDAAITQLIITNLKERSHKSLLQQRHQPIAKDGKPLGFNSKENGSNLSQSNFVNYFDQKQIKAKRLPNQFYLKALEVSLMKVKLAEEFMAQIKSKFYIAYHDSLTNTKSDSLKKKVDIYISSSKGCSADIQRIIDHSINHLYPLRKEKEDLMSEELIQEKMIEYHFSGKLSKQVNMQDIMSNYKISKKKKASNDFNLQMNLTNMLVNQYNEGKVSGLAKRKKAEKPKSVEIAELTEPKDYFIYTKSKLYVKLNRNRDDIKLSSNKVNKKHQLPPMNKIAA